MWGLVRDDPAEVLYQVSLFVLQTLGLCNPAVIPALTVQRHVEACQPPPPCVLTRQLIKDGPSTSHDLIRVWC